MSLLISDNGFASYKTASTDVFATDDGSNYVTFDLLTDPFFHLKSSTTYTARVYVYGQIDDSPQNAVSLPDGNPTFTVTASDSDMFQWQRFKGTIWIDLTDTGIYSGTTTDTLTIANPSGSANGNQYRVLVSNSSYVCSFETSENRSLTIKVNTVITNRRIRHRVNKN